MALSHWSFERLLARVGTAAVLVLFVPMGLYLIHNVSTSVEQGLSQRGGSLVTTLAGEIIEPLLLEDRLAVHDALARAAAADSEVRYLCIENEEGRIVAHTFGEGYPSMLKELWSARPGKVARFRTQDEKLMDVSAPILGGQLGTLHVGISRSRAEHAANRLLWLMGMVLVAALGTILVGARVVAASVSGPLRRLTAAVSMFPDGPLGEGELKVSGTLEVESLARRFSEMVRRLEQLERDRTVTQESMIHAERLAALGEIAAGLAHEIHNPLDGMLECVRHLNKDPGKSSRAEKYYPMLEDGLQRIAVTMRRMLTFAHSGQKVEPRPFLMGELLDGLQLLVQARLDDSHVRLTWRRPKDRQCACDREGMSQAGLNLILNAVEAADTSPEPQVQIEGTCDAEWVYLTVGDSGPGVPRDLRDRIFKPFFTTRPAGKGTGLGLSVSRQLVRAGGGEVELADQPSSLGGAEFVIKLPRLPAPQGTP